MTHPDRLGDAEIVPFGKYRDRPVTDLLADHDYVTWLTAQPWFAERYVNIYNIITGAGGEPQDTPEHNALQARFLDHDEALLLASRWLADTETLRRDWERDAAGLTVPQRANIILANEIHSQVTRLIFEKNGWDVVIHAQVTLEVTETRTGCHCHCDPDRCARSMPTAFTLAEWGARLAEPEEQWSKCYTNWSPSRRDEHCVADCPASWSSQRYKDATHHLWDQETLYVELKPSLGDDYPTVLRDVIRRRDRDRHWSGRAVVLVDGARFTGVTLEQVRKIFRSQQVALLTTAELPTSMAEWRCRCPECEQAALLR